MSNGKERKNSNESFDKDIQDQVEQEKHELQNTGGNENESVESESGENAQAVKKGGKTKFVEGDPEKGGPASVRTTKTAGMAPLVGGKKKEVLDDDEEKRRKQLKRKAAATCLLCLLLIILIILLLLFLKPDDGGAARAQAEDNNTEAPTTLSPTESPTFIEETQTPTKFPTTKAPTESGPTPMPTQIPTHSPIVNPPNVERSRLPCDEIYAESQGGNHGEGNFPSYWVTDHYICADTFGPDPSHPNRNPWAVAYGRRDCPLFDYADGFDACDAVGARWCSVEELAGEIGQGTGCGGDRMFVWTYSDCSIGGKAGKYMFDYGLRDSKESFFTCETDLNTLSVARCCGDFNEE